MIHLALNVYSFNVMGKRQRINFNIYNELKEQFNKRIRDNADYENLKESQFSEPKDQKVLQDEVITVNYITNKEKGYLTILKIAFWHEKNQNY